MYHTSVVALLSLSLAVVPATAESAPQVGDPAPADDFLDSLQAPVPLENVRVQMDVSDGINLEISYSLREIGHVSVAVHGEEDGSGRGLVTVGDAIVAEVEFVAGALVKESADLTSLRPAQAHAVAASVIQVWQEDVVTEALTTATFDARDLKCTVAGGIAGATAGILVAGTCSIFSKNLAKCGGYSGTAYGVVSHYVSAKCNKAQNN